MSHKTLILSLLVALISVWGFPVMAADAEEAAIKQRIIERLESVDSLKLAGKIGESNVGLLEQRGMLAPAETKIMNEENADRRSLYTILGKRLGLTMSVVGQGRAEELRKKSAVGVWLQDRGGNWYKKQ
ncbi:MAG: DUF1318 domain-containing protein [Verrucomicrobiota bacterium]